MPKERNFNPVQAQRKADKAKALKKGKAEVQERRNEKLARKNPDRLQKQIDDLKVATANGGKLTKHEEQMLGGLEKELRAVKKAREMLGDKAPSVGRSWNRDGGSGPRVLGKRRRDSQDGSSSDEEVPEDVRNIPMPRDTPPPIPKAVLDRWYAKRRGRRAGYNADKQDRNGSRDHGGGETRAGTAAKEERRGSALEPKTVYEAKPVMRNLRQEAVSAFVPSSVQVKMTKSAGQGALVEPEEADKLELEGYMKTKRDEVAVTEEGQRSLPRPTATVEDAVDNEG